MSEQKETIGRTLFVALAVCLVCSVFVAGAAVSLKSLQQQNALLDKQRSILRIAGMIDEKASGAEVRRVFDQGITPRLVDLDTGRFSDAENPRTFDPLKAAQDPTLSKTLPQAEDIASIHRLEHYSVAYLVEKDGKIQTLILPVRGYGLWSTLYGFIALKDDLTTVSGFGFYQHAETPGLGGEVDNPRWLSQWPGKSVYDDNGRVSLAMVKGGGAKGNVHQVDAIAGATLTSRGVEHLVHFWLGPDGFGPFLQNLKKGDA
jgi:Na+-transporting NADH:ubiquinone oxidoreductase subunit C